jgi:hypothetical protein
MNQNPYLQPTGQDAASDAKERESPVAPDLLARGMAIPRQIGGEDFDGLVKHLAQVSPDMADFTVTYPYGDILSRPGLDLRTRQVCTVSCLIAQGSAQSSPHRRRAERRREPCRDTGDAAQRRRVRRLPSRTAGSGSGGRGIRQARAVDEVLEGVFGLKDR